MLDLLTELVTKTSICDFSESRPLIYLEERIIAWPESFDDSSTELQHHCLTLDSHSVPYVLSTEERSALERALWRSVDVIDDGSEG